MTEAELVERYLLVGLRLGRHVDGLVDAYYGPAGYARTVAAEPLTAPGDLAAEAAALEREVDAVGDAQRSRWLSAQLAGLRTTAERLAGRPIPYREEIRHCYGVELVLADEDELAEAHRRLAELLPGAGSLPDRYQAWRRSMELAPTAVMPAVTAVAEELRGRTRATYGLPEGETAEVEQTSHQPWAAFNYYLGGLRSRIAFNTDVPARVDYLVQAVAHEIYPGHHTEHATKESDLVRRRNQLEESIFLVGTPQCLIAEGVATHALDALGRGAEEACGARLAELGCAYDVELSRSVRDVEAPMRRVWHTVAFMLHEQRQSVDEARAYARRWLLDADERLEKTIEFVQHPVWRAYVVVYDAGQRLVERWTAGDPARFRRLLTEQLTPADLS